MAIYHLSVKTISRSAGRSATAAAAYRSGVKIVDERTGEIHDYTRKGGVESTDLVLPEGGYTWAEDRTTLWNAAEQAEKRKNSTVAREFVVALPAELDAAQRRDLALQLAGELAERHQCAVDVSIHAPGREGDDRNHHAHILTTTRRIGPEGMGEKCRELDDLKSGEVVRWRQRWAELSNAQLQRFGHDKRIDHRSHAERGLQPEMAGIHLGPTATAIERKGKVSERGERNRTIRAAKDQTIAKRLERKRLETPESIDQRIDAAVLQTLEKQPALTWRDLPIDQVVQSWTHSIDTNAAVRHARAGKALGRAEVRHSRREQAADAMKSTRPEEPTGLLAKFKQRAYQEANDLWQRAYAYRKKLAQQAQGLHARLWSARSDAKEWAEQQLTCRHPDIAQRIDEHREEERAKRIQQLAQERKDREAQRALQRGDRGRGR